MTTKGLVNAPKWVDCYKVFDKNLECRRFKYSKRKVNIHKGSVIPCHSGFHACSKLVDCFDYTQFSLSMRVFKVRLHGTVIKDGNKYAASKLTILKELSFWEIDELVNEGKNNLGYGNKGNGNKGNGNTGSYNIGNDNKGNDNKGHYNIGNGNIGNGNIGNGNIGNGNKGDYNKGDYNKGNYNEGDYNTGSYKTS